MSSSGADIPDLDRLCILEDFGEDFPSECCCDCSGACAIVNYVESISSNAENAKNAFVESWINRGTSPDTWEW